MPETTTTNAPVGPPICVREPPSAEIRKPAIDGAVDAGLRRQPRRDGERHRQRQRDIGEEYKEGMPLTSRDMPGILRRGGTILGTTNRRNPFAYGRGGGGRPLRALRADVSISASTPSSSSAATERSRSTSFTSEGFRWSLSPRPSTTTLSRPTCTFGFDSAVGFATEAIDRLHTTAESHHRIMVVEVMGRYTGWIAPRAGALPAAPTSSDPRNPLPPRTRGAADPGSRAAQCASASWSRRRGRRGGERDRAGNPPRRPSGWAGSARGCCGSRNRDRQGSAACSGTRSGRSSHQR